MMSPLESVALRFSEYPVKISTYVPVPEVFSEAKQTQQANVLLRKQAARLRQMSNGLLKLPIQIDFLH